MFVRATDCRNFSGAQLQWESVTATTARSQAAATQQQQQNHANHSLQSKTSRVHTDDQSDVKSVHFSLLLLYDLFAIQNNNKI